MAKLELDAGLKGWKCSECGLAFDCVGRPRLKQLTYEIIPHSISWIENKPEINYCPSCGVKLERDNHG